MTLKGHLTTYFLEWLSCTKYLESSAFDIGDNNLYNFKIGQQWLYVKGTINIESQLRGEMSNYKSCTILPLKQ